MGKMTLHLQSKFECVVATLPPAMRQSPNPDKSMYNHDGRTIKNLLAFFVMAITAIFSTVAGSAEITQLNPPSADVGWEGLLTIHGSDLGEQGLPGESFVSIEGENATVKFWTKSFIQVLVTKDMTMKSGEKRVVTHDKNAKFAEAKWKVK